MRLRWGPLWSAMLIAALACADKDAAEFESVTLQRTLCYGGCPAYVVRITRDGRVAYEGGMFVKAAGRRTRRLTPAEVNSLRAELSEARFFRWRDRYVSVSDGCTSSWTDQPSAIITVRSRGRTKSIEHYYGCRREDDTVHPEKLMRLATRIDEISGIREWVRP